MLSHLKKPEKIISSVAMVLSVAFVMLIASPLFLSAQTSEPYNPPTDYSYEENGLPIGQELFNAPEYNDIPVPAADSPAFIGPPTPGSERAKAEEAETKAKDALAQKQAAEELAKAFECGFFNPKGCVAAMMDMVLWVAARTLWIAGVLFNITIDYTLNLNTLLTQLPIVDIGWKILRDLANIVFIFIALWAGISITLGIGDDGKKAWGLLSQMVLVALFINFSLFITKAVVDVSNVAALHFYSLIVPAEGAKKYDGGLSEAYLYGLKLGTLYNSKQIGSGEISGDASMISTINRSKDSNKNLSFSNIILIGFFGSLFIIITAWVFFAGAIMFIYRAITLIMLMMLSPLAFVGLILPGASGMAHAWWSKLWSQAFFAPLYLILAYIVVRVINTPAFGSSVLASARTGEQIGGFAAAITGTGSGTIVVIFNFVMLIGLMVACLIVAQSLGAKGSEMAMAGFEKIKAGAIGGAVGALKGTGGVAGRFAIRGFGSETLTNYRERKAARAKELAEMHPVGSAERKKHEGEHEYWHNKAKNGWAKGISEKFNIRKLDEKWERSGGIMGGQGAIGSLLRAQTTKRAVDAKFGTSISAHEAYEADEARISKLKDIEYGTTASEGADRLHPLRQEEHGLQENLHASQKRLVAARKELSEAKKIKDPTAKAAAVAAAQAKVKAAQGDKKGYADAKKELADAQKITDPAAKATAVAAAQAKLDAIKKKGGVDIAKEEIKTFNEEHGAEIEKEMRKIATALARMSTEGFLNMNKSFFTRPEIMDITVLGADKYNALMASDHYTNPEKIEYSEARTERVKTEATRLKAKNEWYLQDKKFWKEEQKEWEAAAEQATSLLSAELKGLPDQIKSTQAEIATAEQEIAAAEQEIAKAEQELKSAVLPPSKDAAQAKIDASKKKRDAATTKRDTAKGQLATDEALLKELPKKIEQEKKDRGFIDAEGNKVLNGQVLREAPKASGYSGDIRKALRNMNNPQEILNYYRYARELIDIPPFVQTVKQGMWNKIRDSAEVDSYTKEKIRVDKRLYMQEASDYQFGLDPVMMKRWEEINSVAAQKFRDVLNQFVIAHSEQEYKDTYFRDGKLNEELKVALPPELLKEFSTEVTADEDERKLRHSTGSGLMKEVLQNLANDEATMMSGTLRNLHWIKRELNRGLFGAFKDRDIDVKIPDMENLIRSLRFMMQGKNEVSRGNLDFMVWAVNERSGKEFIPWEQMSPEVQRDWEAIKLLAKQRNDPLTSTMSEEEVAQYMHEQGMDAYVGPKGTHNMFLEELGIKSERRGTK